ncbi:trace amine-associated receptor 7c-like [Oculina patagonica]
MYNTAAVVIIFAVIFESLIIIVGNLFTIFVFWKHRNRLKRTSFLLINLAVADLLVGFTEPIVIGTYKIPQQIKKPSNNSTSYGFISITFQTTFSFASVFFLVFISLERAYALIWPLRHRVASTKGYIYSVFCVWVAGICVGGLSLLAAYDILDLVHWIVAFCAIIILALTIICVSYLAIRTKLNCRVPPTGTTHYNETVHNQSKKLSRTLFVVIAASLVFWLPGSVVYCIHFLCSRCVPTPLLHISAMLHVANSLVNPIIYSFKIPIFKETLKRLKLKKKSKQYRVNDRS